MTSLYDCMTKINLCDYVTTRTIFGSKHYFIRISGVVLPLAWLLKQMNTLPEIRGK